MTIKTVCVFVCTGWWWLLGASKSSNIRTTQDSSEWCGVQRSVRHWGSFRGNVRRLEERPDYFQIFQVPRYETNCTAKDQL